jgi:N-acetylglucosaminyldiphosphoundecaprenol N-acetyl-beta-D-mannosaminyltransferase
LKTGDNTILSPSERPINLIDGIDSEVFQRKLFRKGQLCRCMRSVTFNPNTPNHPDSKKFLVLGFPVHLQSDYVGWLSNRILQKQGAHVVTLNAEMTMQAEQSPALAQIIHQADLVIPDGAGIVLYLKLHGQTVNRCPGIELAEALLKESTQQTQPWPVFFFGGSPGVAEEATQRLRTRLPHLNIVGVQNGYLDAAGTDGFLEHLRSLNPAIIYVGLGVPRQEHWIAEHRHLVPDAIWIGVGGSFDIWAERKQRAPGWLRNNNLEWVYRLYQEPWRWRRMLALPHFAWRSVLAKFKQ